MIPSIPGVSRLFQTITRALILFSPVKIDDAEAFESARRIIKTEGILCGGSCGSALAGTLRYLKTEEGKKIAENPAANIVVLLPDSLVNSLFRIEKY